MSLPEIILASASPRRSDLLRSAGVRFRVEPARVDEVPSVEGCPRETATHNATLKAVEVAGRFPGRPVLGADTVVALGERILGKPAHEEEARAMLRELSGRTHSVVTGVCLVRPDGSQVVFAVESRVRFYPLTDREIAGYIADVHVLDKAGAYALQEEGARIVQSVEGSRDNVIGLPVAEVLAALTRGQGESGL